MFYRRDILGRLGIEPESLKTWQDVMNVLPDIQATNMNFALPAMISPTVSAAPNTYAMFLYQRGGGFYANDGRESALGEQVALDAFWAYTRFYTGYGLPFIYDFGTRFRTGELPLGIADFTSYNLLRVSAPEIQGLWGMLPVPGTPAPDGINSTVPVSGTASVIMKAAKNKQACWEFLKWWVSEDTQYDFGREMESVLGVGARYHTANLKTFARLPWTAQERNALLSQAEHLKGIPEVPGGYISTRSIDFAVKAVYNTGEDARTQLLSYVPSINWELSAKRKEFHMDADMPDGSK